jgi:hypothetical protein
MTDDGGVLGNLPSSRPGRRSAKRDPGAKRPAKTASAGRPANAASEAAKKAEASGKAAADPPRTAKAARTSAKPGRAAAGKASPRKRTTAVKGAGSSDRVGVDPAFRGKRRHDPVSTPEPAGQALGAVVRGAAGVAVTGVRVAGAVTQELLRRLPRP